MNINVVELEDVDIFNADIAEKYLTYKKVNGKLALATKKVR